MGLWEGEACGEATAAVEGSMGRGGFGRMLRQSLQMECTGKGKRYGFVFFLDETMNRPGHGTNGRAHKLASASESRCR